jgi:CRP-like cAMP-binding protein
MKNELSSFRFFTEEDLTKIGGYFECAQAAAGDELWQEGAPSGCVFFIMSGRVEIKKQTEFKGKEVVVGVYSQGAMAATSAKALEDVSLVLLRKAKFDELIEVHPTLGVQLLKGMLLTTATRLRKSYDRLAAIF